MRRETLKGEDFRRKTRDRSCRVLCLKSYVLFLSSVFRLSSKVLSFLLRYEERNHYETDNRTACPGDLV